jgi:hypothetical protein
MDSKLAIIGASSLIQVAANAHGISGMSEEALKREVGLKTEDPFMPFPFGGRDALEATIKEMSGKYKDVASIINVPETPQEKEQREAAEALKKSQNELQNYYASCLKEAHPEWNRSKRLRVAASKAREFQATLTKKLERVEELNNGKR